MTRKDDKQGGICEGGRKDLWLAEEGLGWSPCADACVAPPKGHRAREGVKGKHAENAWKKEEGEGTFFFPPHNYL